MQSQRNLSSRVAIFEAEVTWNRRVPASPSPASIARDPRPKVSRPQANH